MRLLIAIVSKLPPRIPRHQDYDGVFQESWLRGRRFSSSMTTTLCGGTAVHFQNTRLASRAVARVAKLGTMMPAQPLSIRRSASSHVGTGFPVVARSSQALPSSASDVPAATRAASFVRSRTPSQSTSAPSGGDWKKYSDSTRRSGEASPANPSLLDQLEQAEPSSATPAPASNSPQSQGELRTWTSVDGRTFEGTIVEGSLEAASRQEAGQKMVTVKRKDGQVFNIPIERLGEEDRAYLDALYKTRSAVNWTEGKDSRMGKGEAYQQSKPAGNSNKNPTSKPKYIGENPKEVYQRPPSSSRGLAKRTG